MVVVASVDVPVTVSVPVAVTFPPMDAKADVWWVCLLH
jgi:hypothetical protein